MSRSDLANHPAVSFTVKRPPPVSRGTSESSSTSSFKAPAEAKRSGASGVAAPSPLAISNNGNGKRRQTQTHHDDDSSDDDAGTEDEIITGFDSLGVQRCVQFSLSHPEERMLKTYTQPHMSHILVRKSGQLKAHLSFLLSPIETGELRPADVRVPQFSSQILVELPLVSVQMEVLVVWVPATPSTPAPSCLVLLPRGKTVQASSLLKRMSLAPKSTVLSMSKWPSKKLDQLQSSRLVKTR